MPIAVCKRGDPSGASVCPIPGALLEKTMSDERIDAYDYALPEDRIAQRPAPRRDGSRLMVARRGAASAEHRQFLDLPDLLEPDDLLVVNDTRVIPARIHARKPTGARVEVLLLQPRAEGDGWEALVRPSARVRPGTVLQTVRGAGEIGVEEALTGGHRRVTLPDGADLSRFGEPPLPPYIRRPDGVGDQDWERYQTVYASCDGAVAAPTAGLHFTEAVLERVRRRGVGVTRVTLHVGAGTFEPVRAATLGEHAMHGERYRVPVEAAEAIADARTRGGRIVAVGTTVVRTLEAWAREGTPSDGAMRSTELFLQPGEPFLCVDAMLTNFHLPRSTLLVLISAFAGREWILDRYREAVREGYRFYSYGDAMLLL